MPLLPDPKHERIVQAYVKGSGQLESYNVIGWDRSASAASKFFNKPEVVDRIREVRELRSKLVEQREIESSADAARKLGLTKFKILQALWYNAESCLRGAPIIKDGEHAKDESGNLKYGALPSNPTAANQALKLIGMEAHGMFIERLEVGNPGDFARLTDDELFLRVESDAAALGLPADATEALRITFQQGGETDGGEGE